MLQLCRKQTGLCRQILTVHKIDNKTFRMYRTKVRQKAQYKLYDRMHIIFANFDICLIVLK